MNSITLKQMRVDDSRTICIVLPPEMGDCVEITVVPAPGETNIKEAGALPAKTLLGESGFAVKILNNFEEDCWNDL